MIEYRYDVPFKFTGKINKLTSTSNRRLSQHQKLRQNWDLA